MTTFLGIDHGSKNIGLALGDDSLKIATPLGVMAPDEFWKALPGLLEEYGIKAFVVGMPLTLKSQKGLQAGKVDTFIEQLRQSSGLVVHEADERFTSRLGEQFGDGSDAQAARIILQDFLDNN